MQHIYLVIYLLTDFHDVTDPFELFSFTNVFVHKTTDMHPVVVTGQTLSSPTQRLSQDFLAMAIKVCSIPSTAAQLVAANSILGQSNKGKII